MGLDDQDIVALSGTVFQEIFQQAYHHVCTSYAMHALSVHGDIETGPDVYLTYLQHGMLHAFAGLML